MADIKKTQEAQSVCRAKQRTPCTQDELSILYLYIGFISKAGLDMGVIRYLNNYYLVRERWSNYNQAEENPGFNCL